MNSDTLKKRLRYQGKQYSSGQFARGGGQEKHMLTQAAERIEELEKALNDILNDCINFNGVELTPVFMENASNILKGDKENADTLTHVNLLDYEGKELEDKIHAIKIDTLKLFNNRDDVK